MRPSLVTIHGIARPGGCLVVPTGKRVIELNQSNRLEVLAAQLAESLLQADPDDVLRPALVLVPHLGMARWLRRWLAEHIGICANVEFVLPAVFAWRVLAARLAPAPRESVYAREVLVWRILALLPGLLEQPAFAGLQRYLGGDVEATRSFPLAARLADCYDRYLVYRADWLLAWEKGRLLGLGGDEAWQQGLWQALAAQVQEPHRASLFQRLLQRSAAPTAALLDTLPATVHGFGLSQLAPVHLDVLRWLDLAHPVRLYQLNYSLHYWDDLTDARALARLRARRLQLGLADRPTYHEVGHPLLAAWARPGQDFLRRLHADERIQEVDAFVVDESDTALARLQRSLLLLEPALCATLPAPDDHSLQLHACANRLREVEALHDALLDAFSADPGLLPRDVVVMVPDIADYAHVIAAVFAAQAASRQIPFRIADRSLLDQHPLLQAFGTLLQLPSWRFSASEVFGFLSQTEVMRRFEISAQERASLLAWIERAGIRWGLDADFRFELGIAGYPAHSWRDGLDRLLAGYALGDDVGLWHDLAPLGDVEGQRVLALGKLETLLDGLRRLRRQCAQPRPMAQWQQLLLDALAQFFAVAADDIAATAAAVALREAIGALGNDAARAGFVGPVAFSVLRTALEGKLAEPGSFSRFPGDGVTFCTLVPLRAVPFRVVALLGMNDGEFPRNAAPLAFDLLRQHVRSGDRNGRDDDRYLFLEALLAARDRVHLSFIDRRAEDGQARPPSALLDELLEFFAATATPDASAGSAHAQVRAALLRRHPLHAFAREYFVPGNRLQSFAAEWLPAARTTQRGLAPPRFAAATSAMSVVADADPLTLATLLRFFANPAQVQLRERCDIDLHDDSSELLDDEAFVLEGLPRYQARLAMLDYALAHGALPFELPDELRLGGWFPPGPAASHGYAEHRAPLEHLALQVRAMAAADVPAGSTSAMLRLGGIELQVEITEVERAGLLGYRVGSLRARDHLRAWLLHLVLSAGDLYRPGSTPVYLGIRATQLERSGFAALDAASAGEILGELIAIHQRSLHGLLPLFAESQYAFAQARLEGKDAGDAALARWHGDASYGARGEMLDPYAALLARGREPLVDEEFVALALAMFTPLLAAQRRVEASA